MATDAPSQALIERLRSREDDLKKRDKELKLRDRELKDKLEELEMARKSVDGLMTELEERETGIAETEKRLGSVKQREEEAHSRDLILSERESMAQDKLAVVARREKENAALIKQHNRDNEDKIQQLSQREADLLKRLAELQAGEKELNQKSEAVAKRASEIEEANRVRERQFREGENKNSEASRKNYQREQELEHQTADLAERSKVLRAEHLEVETRERDCKWQEEELRVGLEHCTKKKQELQKWHTELSKKQEDLDQRLVGVAHSEYLLESRHDEAKLKITKFVLGEKRLAERVEEFQEDLAKLEKREQNVAKREENVKRLEASAKMAEEEARSLYDTNKQEADALKRRSDVLEQQQHVLREKERALRDWLVELEFREAAIMKKESKPKAYLQQPADEAKQSSSEAVQYNSAVVHMQLDQIQSSYLGATLKRRIQKTVERDARRRQTPLTSQESEAMAHRMEKQGLTSEVNQILRETEKEFKDLTSSYAILTQEEREGIFSSNDETQIVEAIEFETNSYDEFTFMEQLSSMPLPSIDINCSPQDTKLYATVSRWLGERQELINERQRRVQTKRLHAMNTALNVLRGRVRTKNERQQVFSLDFSDGSSGLLDAGYKARARSRLPAVMVNSSGIREEASAASPSSGDGGVLSPKSTSTKTPKVGRKVKSSCMRDTAPPSPLSVAKTPEPKQLGRHGSLPQMDPQARRASTPGVGTRRKSKTHENGGDTPSKPLQLGELSQSPSSPAMPMLASASPSTRKSPRPSGVIGSPVLAPLSAEDRLVDALPPGLRHHYGK